MQKGLKVGKKEREILQTIGVGTLIVGAILVPGLSMALAPFFPKGKAGRQNFRRSVKRLEEKDLLYLSGDKVKLTKKGLSLLEKIQIEDISIEKPEIWDKLWRIIAYDIPDKEKKERDYFKVKLESLGFKKVQESMYAFPYECREEIAVFAQSLGVSPHVLYLTTDHIPRQTEYLKHFKIFEEA